MNEVDPSKPGVNPQPWVGIQYVTIPEFQDVGNQTSQLLADVIAGRRPLDLALDQGQKIAQRAGDNQKKELRCPRRGDRLRRSQAPRGAGRPAEGRHGRAQGPGPRPAEVRPEADLPGPDRRDPDHPDPVRGDDLLLVPGLEPGPAEERSFAGFNNYVAVITNGAFLPSIWATIRIVGGSMILSLLLGLLLAVLLDREFKGRALARTLLITPFLVMPAAAALIWKYSLLEVNTGMVNWGLGLVGIDPIAWNTDHPGADHRVHPDLAVHAVHDVDPAGRAAVPSR